MRAMRAFGNASLMDGNGASSLSSVDSELMSSLAYALLLGFETQDLLKFRNREGSMHKNPSRSDPGRVMRSSDGRLAYGTSGNPQTHIMQEGYVAKIAKRFSVSGSEVPRLLRNVIRDGRIVSNEIRKTNGREGYERIYGCNDGRIPRTGIGLNAFMVSAHPLRSREAQQ